MKELLVEMDRVIQEFKGTRRLFVRRRQGVHGSTQFTVCDEPDVFTDVEATPLLAMPSPGGGLGTPVKQTHLERGGLNRWDFKRKKR